MKSTTNTLPLGKLLTHAAKTTPDALFSRRGDDEGGQIDVCVAELGRRADRHCALWLAAGLSEGARVGMVATPEPEIVAAIAGAARAGVEVVLLSPSLEAPAIAATAGLARISALAGPADFAGVDYAKRLAEARAASGAVAWLMLWEADRPRLFRLDNAQPNAVVQATEQNEAGLATAIENGVQPLDGPHLRAIAGAYAEALNLARGEAIVSLVSPATPAGLAACVHAPLMRGARVLWQAPFSAIRLGQALRDLSPAHLVAPAGVADSLGRAELLSPDILASLTLIVSDSARTPLFEADLDADRVFFLDSRLAGSQPLMRLAIDPDADGAELG